MLLRLSLPCCCCWAVVTEHSRAQHPSHYCQCWSVLLKWISFFLVILVLFFWQSCLPMHISYFVCMYVFYTESTRQVVILTACSIAGWWFKVVVLFRSTSICAVCRWCECVEAIRRRLSVCLSLSLSLSPINAISKCFFLLLLLHCSFIIINEVSIEMPRHILPLCSALEESKLWLHFNFISIFHFTVRVPCRQLLFMCALVNWKSNIFLSANRWNRLCSYCFYSSL